MAEGTLIAESLKIGVVLGGLPLEVTEIVRRSFDVDDGAAQQPSIWTFIEFVIEDDRAVDLSTALAHALDESGGWYCDFRTAHETFVVFPGRVFRYERGDGPGRLAAAAHAHEMGIPEAQIDWPE